VNAGENAWADDRDNAGKTGENAGGNGMKMSLSVLKKRRGYLKKRGHSLSFIRTRMIETRSLI
jgi:hypothetical protein